MFLSAIKFRQMTNEIKYLTFVMFHGFFLQKKTKEKYQLYVGFNSRNILSYSIEYQLYYNRLVQNECFVSIDYVRFNIQSKIKEKVFCTGFLAI